MRLKIDHGMRTFGTVWLGQFVSILGSGLTSFALSLWLLQKTGSATVFAAVNISATIPTLLISPVAGAIVDRLDRRRIMIAADSIGSLISCALVVLFSTNRLSTLYVCMLVAISATVSAFHRPAYLATISNLIPEKHLARADGMVQMSGATAQLVSPLIAGALMARVSLGAIIGLDVASFAIAVLTLLWVRFPSVVKQQGVGASRDAFVSDMLQTWKYLRNKSGLLGLFMLSAGTDFCIGIASILIVPLLMSFASTTAIGSVVSIGGAGMLIGSLVLSGWGGPRRRVMGVLEFTAVLGALLVLAGTRQSVLLLSAVVFGAFFCLAMINGCSQAVFQSAVENDFQGRIFAAAQLIYGAVAPLAYLTAGPLADKVFEPLLQPGGLLVSTVGQLLGTGRGRGIALIFILVGVVVVLMSAAAAFIPSIRSVERQDAEPGREEMAQPANSTA